MALPIKKIYIDTKFKEQTSINNSNFKVDLKQSFTFPENTGYYIDDVCIPHSWYVIEENQNDRLYFYLGYVTPDEDMSHSAWRVAIIDSGNYSGVDLALEMQTKIKLALDLPSKPSLINCIYNSKKNNIIILVTEALYNFKILTPLDLLGKLNDTWLGPVYDINKPNDINELLGNLEGNSPFYTYLTPYRSNYLNLQSIRNIYIHSSLGNYNSLGARGETSIIKKVPVNADSNNYIFDQVLVGNDFGDCSKQTVRTISFEIKDVHGNYINFHGINLSFSIIFSKLDVSG